MSRYYEVYTLSEFGRNLDRGRKLSEQTLFLTEITMNARKTSSQIPKSLILCLFNNFPRSMALEVYPQKGIIEKS